MLNSGIIKLLVIIKNITEKINPAAAPSILLFGLTEGINLCIPNLRPIKNAAESHIQILQNTNTVIQKPKLSMPANSMFRINITAKNESDTYINPVNVVDIPANELFLLENK